MRAIPLVYLCLIVAGISVGVTQPLPKKILFEQIPVPGTIMSSLTEDILQDPYGMLWLGKDVLYRYDGRSFVQYNLIFPDSSEFGRREITKLLWDRPGNRLLVGTRNQGILEYNYQTNQLHKLPNLNGIPIINELVQTADGTVWISSFASGLFRLRNDTLVRWKGPKNLINPTGLIAIGDEVWAACLNELVIFSDKGLTRRIPLSGFAEYIPNVLRAQAIHFDHRGLLWIGTDKDGIMVMDTASNSVVKRFLPNQKPFFNSITRISQDDQKLVWILTKGGGLVVYSIEEDRYIQVSNEDAEGTLSGDYCTSFYLDQSGIVWIGSQGALNKFDRTKLKFEHIHQVADDPLSLSDDNIRGVYEEDGLIYLANSGGYINIVDRKKNKTEKIKVSVKNDAAFITPLYIHKKDPHSLFVGTAVGLLVFDKRTKQFDYFAPLKDVTLDFPVRQIQESTDFLFLLVRGRVLRYHKQTGEISFFDSSKGIPNATHVSIDSYNRLWIGINSGIAYYDPEFKNLTTINFERLKFRPDSAYFLTLSMQQIGQKLWVGTFNYGIYILDLAKPKPEVVEHITIENGLPDNTIYSTLPDKSGQVWIAHNSGLSRYHPGQKTFITFSTGEGLQDEEFNRLAYYQTAEGQIILGGINGINVFHPDQINTSKVNLNVQLTRVRFLTNDGSSGNEINLLTNQKQISLNYEKHSLQFEFFVPDFHDPIRYRIYYKLEPFDNKWIETSNFYSSNYVNLPAGDYSFFIKAVTMDGVENAKQFSFTILPPFWSTWWFILICFSLVILIIYSIIYNRVKKSERDRHQLETLLKIRTQEIERSREELENLNKKKDFIFSILSHDLRSPLTTLKGFLGLLIENMEMLSKEDVKKYAATIRTSVANSLDLIDNTLFWSLSQTGNIQWNPSKVHLNQMFETVKGLYQLTAEKKQIHLSFSIEENLYVQADENMLYVILRNLISNALKFTPEGKSVFVTAAATGTHISIDVKDEGIGLSPHEIANIFELDSPALKKGTSSEKGTGLGLLLCKKFVELNKGKLTIHSELNKGSEFNVTLPVG